MKIRLTIIYIFLGLFPLKLFGQNDTLVKPPLSLSGYLDVYYAYDFNEPSSGDRAFLANNTTYIFSHSRHNEVTLNNAIIFLNYDRERIRAALSFHAGTYVNANYSHEPGVLKNIYEAYAGFRLAKNLWADAGIFTSHIGDESAIAIDNYTPSRSIMADNTPYYESGVKLTYSKSEKMTVTLLLLNGWQNIRENNNNKAFGSQIQIRPVKNLLFNSSTFIGKETSSFDSVPGMRYFHNFYSEIKIKKMSILTAFDLGLQEKRTSNGFSIWYNPNLKIRYRLSDKIAIAARAEYYHDRDGVIINPDTPNGFQVFAPSFNFDFNISENTMWRIEGRVFNSKYPVYKREQDLVKQDSFLLTSLSMKLK